MSNNEDREHLVIEPVPESRQQEFIDLVYTEFFPREVMAIASGLDRNTNPGTIDTFVGWLHQGYSLAVIDKRTDKLVGVALNCVIEKLPPGGSIVDYSTLKPEDSVIWTMLDELDAGYDVFTNLQVDRGLELVFLCVASDYTGKGLARRLTEATIKLAKERGLAFIKSNPSTFATRHVFESLGFETFGETKLTEFQFNGKPGFPNAKPGDIVRLSVKKL